MARIQFSHLSDQYKQFLAGFKSAWVVDTITTRFLLLFLILLAIPLITVILFTTSLLANEMETSSRAQLLLSRSLLEDQLASARERLAIIGTRSNPPVPNPSYRQVCPERPGRRCFLIHEQSERVYLDSSTTVSRTRFFAMAPAFEAMHRKNTGNSSFFARWQSKLYLFEVQALPSGSEVFRGTPVDNQFLGRLYRQIPSLRTKIWILEEPAPGAQPRLIAYSPNSLPDDVPLARIIDRLRALEPADQARLALGRTTYQILQEPVYTPDHRKIARMIHLFPLSQNQLLLSHYYMGIYIIAVASLMFSVLLAMGAGRTITQPLLKLIRQVNNLSRESALKGEVSVQGVHEIRQLGEAFNRMIKRLRQEYKIKDEFVATLTHDLKVPLLAEKQTLAYFKKETYGPLTEEQADVLDILQSSNASCLDLVNGLLEVYRYDAGEVSLVFESFNLARLLHETLDELGPLAQAKNIEMALAGDLPETDESAAVYADRLEIKRVLHNLISNAITNTPAHGKISCRLTNAAHHGSDTVHKVSHFRQTTLKQPVKLEDRVLLTVQDSGIGFATEDMPHVFQQFAAGRGRNPMSIGLGLYNCHQVIQAHNGLLWVESSEGEGTVVGFVLPRNQQTARDRRVYRDRRKQS